MIDMMRSTPYTDHELRDIMWQRVDQQVSAYDRMKLIFIAIGVALAKYQPTAAEQQEIAKLQTLLETERVNYDKDVADNQLLSDTIDYERALTRLAQPALNPAATDANGNLLYPDITLPDGTTATNPALVQDQQERAAAQAIVDAVTPEILALYDQRHPVAP